MIAIAGATGTVGSIVARELLRRGEAVRVLVRTEDAATEWRARGAETVVADLTVPNSLNDFCRGADAIVATASALLRSGADTIDTVDVAGNRHLVDAAVRTGVKRFVFVSAAGASTTSRIAFLRAKAIAEEYVRAKVPSWTILAPHLLMETWIELIVGIPVRAGIPVSLVGAGRTLQSFISAQDVAAFVVAALGDAAIGRRLVLGGTLPVSWQEVVEQCRELVEAPIDVRSLPPGFSFPHIAEPLGRSLAFIAGALEERDAVIDSAPAYAEFRIEPTPLRSYLVGMLADRRRPFRGQPAAAPPEGTAFDLPSSFTLGEDPPAPPTGESEASDSKTSTPREKG
ncbi:MAG TPA: NAD(P)H-binding protein [Thermoanaerobaculia bacterium]